jgi:hypothetical protein
MTKLSISQAWDETRAILARDGKLIVAVALALFVLPGILLNVLLPQAPAGEMPGRGAWVLVALLVLLISLLGQLAVIRLALGPHVSVGEAIAHGARRLLSYVGAILVWTLPLILVASALYEMAGTDRARPSPVAAVGLLALGLIGLFLSVRLVLLSAVASAEHGGPVAVLRRTWELTSGNWWRLFGFLLVFAIAALALIWALRSVVGLIAQLAFGSVAPLSIGGLIVIIVAQLLSAAISVVLVVMIARIYAQRTGRGEAQAGVPNSGT